MKTLKKLLLLASIITISFLTLKTTTHTSASSVNVNGTSTNFTINQMIKQWKGESRKDFDDYFKDYANDQRILAGDDHERGIFSYKPGISPKQMKKLPNNRYQLPDGTIGEYVPEIEGPQGTTVGEMKNALYPYLKN